MRCLAISLTLACLALTGLSQSQGAQAQTLGPGIGFRNDLKVPVIVQGVSLVNNMQRRGQPFVVQPGKTVWDNNLPMGLRYYTIYEASQQRIVLKDQNVKIQSPADQFFSIRLVGNAVKMEQEPVPKK
jgi:hypothetical protein